METLGPREKLQDDNFVEVTEIVPELAQQAVMRSRIYKFLTDAYILLPDEHMASRLLKENRLVLLAHSWPENLLPEVKQGLILIWDFASHMAGRPLREIKELLSVDRTRLFRGLMPGYGPPPPYESVYLGNPEAPFFQAASEVASLYAKVGVGFSPRIQEQADYIGVETDFMRILTEREAAAWKDTPEEALRWLLVEQEFLRDHLLRWVPNFCEIVVREAESDFYRGVAMLTHGFLTSDLEWVKHLLSQTE